MYVAIVVGVGAIVGSGNSENLALSVAATAIVAVAFPTGPHPGRALREPDRLRQARDTLRDPRRVLGADGRGLRGRRRAPPDESGPGRGDRGRARGGVAARRGRAPVSRRRGPPRPVPRHRSHSSTGELPTLPGADVTYPVNHQGDSWVPFSVTKPANDPAPRRPRRATPPRHGALPRRAATPPRARPPSLLPGPDSSGGARRRPRRPRPSAPRTRRGSRRVSRACRRRSGSRSARPEVRTGWNATATNSAVAATDSARFSESPDSTIAPTPTTIAHIHDGDERGERLRRAASYGRRRRGGTDGTAGSTITIVTGNTR